jgi:uncharacterized protein (DUF2252 family)
VLSTSTRRPRDRAELGKAARAGTPRSSHAAFEAGGDRNPLGLLEEQAGSRVAELVPIRYGRMVASPLAFFRGAAIVMAHDLAATPTAGLSVQLCGDAHLLNFGGFASPERTLVFDLNDFDETLPGPFEWDVKRLAASFEIAGREQGLSRREREGAVLAALRSYREAMRRFASQGDLDVWYARLDANDIRDRLRAASERKLERSLQRSEARAFGRDRMRALAKLTRSVDGEPKLVSDPPLLVPLEELDGSAPDAARLQELFGRYRETLRPDRRVLLDRFEPVDLARKVVGVGSVGTRCWLLFLLGRDETDPLFLQIKEAQASVLEPLLGESTFPTHARRIVEGQRLMQAASDIFLGWVHSDEGLDGDARDFYVRQLWDWKISVDLGAMTPRGLVAYADVCGWTLARAHARSGDRIAIASYLGAGDQFDRAVASFAAAYADVNERDHRALVEAVAEGRMAAG